MHCNRLYNVPVDTVRSEVCLSVTHFKQNWN